MFQILVYSLLVLSVSSLPYGIQQTLPNGEQCTIDYTRGYEYHNWYNASEIFEEHFSRTGTVMFKFYVQASSDAHVMLAKEPASFGYEIVLGGGFNSFCEIRKADSSSSSVNFRSVATETTEKILNSSNPVGFWVRATQESGLIEVGKNGKNMPFMYWADPDEPIPVKYFSFSSWGSVVCKWIFKCKPDPLAVKPRTAVVTNTRGRNFYSKKFLTSQEQLRRDVVRKHSMFGGDPMTNAQRVLNVAITSNFKFIHLDVMTSTLTLRGIATFEWTDNSIRWNPQDYKNISRLHLSNYELWQPELVLHNAMDPAKSMFSESKVSVDNNGNVTWRPKFDIKTKCDIDLTSWPWDKHKCTILLSTWSHKISNVFYEIKENQKSECFQVSHSDWRLDRMTSSFVEDSTPWDDIVASVNDFDSSKDDPAQFSLQLVVEISRDTKILEKLFYVPLLLISCVWLSSFGMMPNSSSKITTICVSIILSILIVVYMTKHVPVFTESPPDLMLGYLKLILLISMDAFISSLLITVHSRKTTSGHPPFALTRFLTTPVVTKLLALPKLDSTRSPVCDRPDRIPDAAGYETATTLWDIVVVAFERIVFASFFAITMAVLLSVKLSVTALS